MKKISKLLVIALLISCFSGMTVFAADNSVDDGFRNVTFETQEIVDKNILFDRAKKNISDINGPKTKFQMNNDDLVLETYSTTQLLKVEKNDLTGEIKKSYVTTNFAVINEKESPSNKLSSVVATIESNPYNLKLLGVAPFLVAGSKSDYGWDSTSGVKASATINWTTYTNYQGSGLTFYKLTSASGNWQNVDTQLIIFNREVRLVCTGTAFSGMGYVEQKTSYYTPSSNSYSYSAPGSWVPVCNIGEGFYVGVIMNCDIKRSSGSSWPFDWQLYM